MRQWGWIFLVLLCLLPGVGRAADLYSVEVLVDVTDVNASVAREKAMSEANRQAFELILKKLTTSEGVAEMMKLNNNQILNFIKEVSVLSEKTSDVRYIAELKVKLNESLVKTYMNEKNIPFVITTSAKVLVIPVYRPNSAAPAQLWEESNLWRQAWERQNSSSGLVEFVSMEANSSNYDVLTADKALSLDTHLMGWLARKNRVSDVYILEATGAGNGLNIKIYAPSGEGALEESLQVDGAADETLFDKAVSEVKSRITSRVRRQNMAESQKQSEITVLFMYKNLKEWLDLQKQLSDIPYVKQVREEAIGDGKTQFKLVFAGSQERLNQALRTKLFHLQDYGSFYVLESIY